MTVRADQPPSLHDETAIRLPRDIRSWTPEQVIEWTRSGKHPPLKKVPIPKAVRIAVWHRDEGICGLCGEPADPLDWTCDHIMPESIGGPTVVHNLRVTHPRCNRRRPHPLAMTEQDIDDAAMDWTENELAGVWMTFEEFQADPAAAIAHLREQGVDPELLEKLVRSPGFAVGAVWTEVTV